MAIARCDWVVTSEYHMYYINFKTLKIIDTIGIKITYYYQIMHKKKKLIFLGPSEYLNILLW